MLNKRTLVSDAVAHAILPGICLSYILYEEKNYILILLFSFFFGFLCLFLTDYLAKNKRIKIDSSIAISLSFFFALGLVLLSLIQNSNYGSKSGLDKFILGNTSTLLLKDIMVFLITGLVTLIIIIIFFRAFKAIIFDLGFSKSVGFPVSFIQVTLSTLTVFSIIIGIQSVGVILVSSLLITPAALAYFYSNSLKKIIFISIKISVLSCFIGVFISSSFQKMPTGPLIVITLTIFSFIVFIFSPKNGIISIIRTNKKNNIKIETENILKYIYRNRECKNYFSIDFIYKIYPIYKFKIKYYLNNLTKNGHLIKISDTWQLTESGKSYAKRIIKIHRLWEVYLYTRLNLSEDHLHDYADKIEHIITPEMEKKLEKQLNYPSKDPHKSEIIYEHNS